MQAPGLYKAIRKTMLQRILIPSIVFALLLSAFFLLNVPALFYAKNALFLMQVLRLVILVLLLLSLGNMIYMGIIFAFPFLSPGVQRLAKYGDLKVLLKECETELLGKHLVDQDNMVLTNRYLFKFAGTKSAIVPLPSALWVFPLNNMRMSFLERRERMVYFLRVVTIQGDTFRFASLHKKNIDLIIDTLTDRYPNFFYGYSDEHDKMVRFILAENRLENKKKKKGQ